MKVFVQVSHEHQVSSDYCGQGPDAATKHEITYLESLTQLG